MINRYTVFGQPIAHSMSPAIHHLFGEFTQRRILYTRTEASIETFPERLKAWHQDGGKGCNVTSPLKELASQLCDRLNDSARFAQAVNTIEMHRDGSLVGHNTDGMGLLTDIEKNKRVSIKGTRVLMLGAGGAARGTLAPLLSAHPAELTIANRTLDKAQSLAERFSQFGATLAVSYEQLSDIEPFDIVINATSMGFNGEVPPLPATIFAKNALAYDMMYSKTETPFLAWCRNNGAAHNVNGFGMLVEQAAGAYLIWEGVHPKTRMLYPRSNEIIESV